MTTWIWILILIAVLAIVGLAAMAATRRRTTTLRQRFGDEYDRTVQAHDDRRAAEAELVGRQKKRAQLDIRPLSEAERLRFAEDWHAVQERFVDEPGKAVLTADSLVGQVMRARGYPVEDFDTQSALVSVDHPKVVENYRFAHGIYERSQTQQASTEDLREAMLRYRSLFDELLGANGAERATQAGSTAGPAGTTAGTADGSTRTAGTIAAPGTHTAGTTAAPGDTPDTAGTAAAPGDTAGTAGTAGTAAGPGDTAGTAGTTERDTDGRPLTDIGEPATDSQGTGSERDTTRRGTR
jgi:hypothetical protein